MPIEQQHHRLVHGLVAGGERHPEREQQARHRDREVTGQHPALHLATPRHQVGELRARREEVRDRHGDDRQVHEVREHLQPGLAAVAPAHQRRGDDGRHHDAEPRDVVAVHLGERVEEQAVLRGRVRHLGRHQRPTVERADAGDHRDQRDEPCRPSRAPSKIVWNAATNGAPSFTSLSWGTRPMTTAVTAM